MLHAPLWNDGPALEENLLINEGAPAVARRSICSGGGKGGSSSTYNYSNGSSQTTIPPEVLARYNAVNARAETAANQPFQNYGGQFVAPVNPTQQGGIDTISGAAGSWSPYIGAAGSQLSTGLGAANQTLGTGLAQGTGLAGSSLGLASAAGASAAPFNNAAAGLIGTSYGSAQPYNAVATGLALAGTNAVDPLALNTGAYFNPYMSAVVDPTVAQLQNVFGQQQRDLTGSQILHGTFGSDRGGIGKATLANQQNLALGQTLGGLYNQNYAQALGAAQQQQGVGLGAAQANRAALQQGSNQLQGLGQQVFGQGLGAAQGYQGVGNQVFSQGLGLANQQLATGSQLFNQGNTAAGTYGNLGIGGAGAYSGLGTTNLSNALTQGQAQIGAGTVQQQTEQAQNQALYNQFLQEQGYPFQVAQFLAGIAEGTGALSGSTTTTSGSGGGGGFSPQPFFSDERLKEDVRVIGATRDGIPIVSFKYKGSPHTQVGMLAQDVEKKRPEAVGMDQGYKTVDYDAATRLHRPANDDQPHGLVPAQHRQMRAYGGGTMDDLLALHQAMYPGAINARGIGSGPRGLQLAPVGAHQILQGPKVELPKMEMPKPAEHTGLGSAISGVNDAISAGKGISSAVSGVRSAAVGSPASGSTPASSGIFGSGGKWDPDKGWFGSGSGSGSGSSASPSAPITSSPLPAPSSSAPSTPDATSPTGFSSPNTSALEPSAPSDAVASLSDGLEDLGGLSWAARGGRIGRANGGPLPYDTGDGYVPESESDDPARLVAEQRGLAGAGMDPMAFAPKGGGGGGGGGGSTFGDVLKGVGTIASLVSLFRDGGAVGRRGLAGGGVPPDDLPPFQTTPELGLAGRSNEPFDPAAEVQDDLRREKPAGLVPAAATAAPTSTPLPSTMPTGASLAAPVAAPTGLKLPARPEWDAMLDRSERAIATWETHQDPKAGWGTVGPPTKYPDGRIDKPYGKFGVMGENVGPWTERWLGRRMTPQEFLADPEAQRGVFRGQFGDYVRTYGSPQKASGAWFAGPQGLTSNAQDVLGTNVPWYMKRFTALYNGEPDPGARDPNGTEQSPARGVAAVSQAPASGLVPAGGTIPPSSGELNPLTGRRARDPNAGFFDEGGFLDRNQREIATGLSFLGNMLASPSRTLAGSVGSGLAAAAPTWLAAGNRQQELGQAQQQIGQGQERIKIAQVQQLQGIWTDLMARIASMKGIPGVDQGMIRSMETQAAQYRQKIMQLTGTDPATPTVQGALSTANAVTSAPLAPPAGGGISTPPVPPATASPQAPPNAPQEAPLDWWPKDKARSWVPTQAPVNIADYETRMHPMERPSYLRELAAQVAFDPRQKESYLNKATAAEQRFKSGEYIDTSGTVQRVPGFAGSKQIETNIADNADYRQKAAAAAQSRQQEIQRYQALSELFQRFESGAFAGDLNEMFKALERVGVKPPDSLRPEDADRVIKNALDVSFNTLQGMGGAPSDKRFEGASHVQPGIGQNAVANRSIIAMRMAGIEQANRMYEDYLNELKAHPDMNRADFENEWRKAHPLNADVKRVEKEIAVRGGTPTVRNGIPDTSKLEEGQRYVLEPYPGAPFDKPTVARYLGRDSNGQAQWGK